MGVWLLLPALSPLVELVLVLLPCSVEVTGAITVLSRLSCKNQKILGILPGKCAAVVALVEVVD
jgi:hypothetical protein